MVRELKSMRSQEKYMTWIKDFAKASYGIYAGNTIDAFQPLDFFHFFGLWYDLWLIEVLKALDKLDVDKKHYKDLKHLLPMPSNMRAILIKAIPSYVGAGKKNKEVYRRFTNFKARMLQEACIEDPFGKYSTPLHRREEVEQIMKTILWRTATESDARVLGKLITAAASIVHGLYNDVVTDFGWDAYGPYHKHRAGKNLTLLIRDFPDLQPHPLWPKELMPEIKKFQIYQLFEKVEWEISCVGCHTILKSGNPISGLRYFAVIADGKPLTLEEIKKLTFHLATKAESLYKEIRKKDFEELKLMVMWQECYQLKALLEAAGMDWRPTAEMLDAIKNQPLQTGVLPHGVMMTSLDQYMKEFHLETFEKEVLKN